MGEGFVTLMVKMEFYSYTNRNMIACSVKDIGLTSYGISKADAQINMTRLIDIWVKTYRTMGYLSVILTQKRIFHCFQNGCEHGFYMHCSNIKDAVGENSMAVSA